MNEKWNRRFMALAQHIASWSKDQGTKVGAVIVDPDTKAIRSMGFNGFPRGVREDVVERNIRPEKYLWTCHAEANAILLARSNLEGCVLFCTLFPCADCTRAIIQSGLRRVVVQKPSVPHPVSTWDQHWVVARTMLTEACVQLVELDALPSD